MLGGIKRSESKAIAKEQTQGEYTPERCADEKESIIPRELSDCARNVGEFYIIKKSSDKGEGIPIGYVLDGGAANRRANTIASPTHVSRTPYSYERSSEKAPFDVRDAMYTGYGCQNRIAYFDPQDKSKIEYVFYVYNNPRNKDGVLGIIEPFEGDRETRVLFIPKEQIQSKQENEEEFLKNLGKEYTNMSGQEFAKQNGTSIIRHTGTMDDFSKKIGGILGLETITNTDPQYRNIRKIRERLWPIGKEECKTIVYGIDWRRFRAAENAIGPAINELGKTTKEEMTHG